MNLSKRNFFIILTAVSIVVFGLGVIYGQFLAKNSDSDIFAASLEAAGNAGIAVDLKGAVKNPGVYNLPEGTRVGDLFDQAELLEDADTSAINLARILKDEEIIVVPYLSQNSLVTGTENKSGDGSSSESGASGDITQKININTASLEELDTLPGIGPAKAGSIINYRLEHGSFSSIDEIMNVSGIGEVTFAKFKDLITVD